MAAVKTVNHLLKKKQIIKMVQDLNNLAPVIIFVIGLIFRERSLMLVGLIFCINLSNLIDSDHYYLYYISCALVSLICLEVTETSNSINNATKNHIEAFIYINLLGWACWVSYIKHAELYNLMCLINYGFIIVFSGIDQDGKFRKRRRNDRANKFFSNDHSDLFYPQETKTKG